MQWFPCIWIQVLEEIRVGLELNDYAMQQRQLAHMRFLGELYNYEHIDSSVIFDTLYLITVFGHGTLEVSKHIQTYQLSLLCFLYIVISAIHFLAYTVRSFSNLVCFKETHALINMITFLITTFYRAILQLIFILKFIV